MLRRISNNKAQVILEFAVVVAICVAALMAMRIFTKRAYAGKLKESADRIGDQFSPNGHVYQWNTLAVSGGRETVSPTGATTTTGLYQFNSRSGVEGYAGYNNETFWPGN